MREQLTDDALDLMASGSKPGSVGLDYDEALTALARELMARRRATLAAVISKTLACTEDDLRELGAFLKAKGRAAKPSLKAARLMFGGEVVNALFDIEASSAPDAVARLVEAAKWVRDQSCEGFCRDLPRDDYYDKEMDIDCAGCRVRAALAAMEASHDRT